MRAEGQGEVEELRERIDVLETELAVRSRWDEDLRLAAENLDARMLVRDEEIAELRRIEETLREEVEWRRQTEVSLREERRASDESHERVIEGLQRQVEGLQRELAAMRATRLWRWGERYWAWKAALRRKT